MDCSTPGLPVHHQLLEFTQTHVHWVGDAIQTSHPLSFLGTDCLGTDVFRNRFYDLNPCISSYLEKHWIPSWWYQILMTNKKPLVKWVLYGTELPLHQNLIYFLLPLPLWSRAIWDAASRAAVLILPQIKVNSQLSSCTSFLVDRSTYCNLKRFGRSQWDHFTPIRMAKIKTIAKGCGEVGTLIYCWWRSHFGK